MKKNSIVATGLALFMIFSLTATAFAAPATDGEEALIPKGDGTGTQESTGAATVESVNGTDFYTENDDDATDKTTDVGGADINVWAKVVDRGSKIYKVDLAWGAMKFEFNSGSGQWDTTTHTYANTGGTAEWTEATFIDGTNNKLAVTNHSNNAVDAGLAYAMTTTGAFNDNESGDNAVIGHFYATNANAVTGSKTLTGTYTGGTATVDANAITKVSLPTADVYTPTDGTTPGTEQAAGARTTSTFFAFGGTPDEGRGASLDTFKKVGVITVTVAPSTYLPTNDTEAGTFN